MRRLRLVPLWLSLLAAAGDLWAGGRPMNLPRSETNRRTAPLFWLQFYGGNRYTFETRNLARGCDTVLTLFRSTEGPVARNDDAAPGADSNGGNGGSRPGGRWTMASRLTFTAPRTDIYAIMVSAAPGTLGGTCDLYMNGNVFAKGLRFGDRFKPEKRYSMPTPVPGRTTPEPEMPFHELPRPSQRGP
ncbi:MAG: hypothetical protein HY815_06305 [Candidatus Riflebacteria bacterium]|nr:hypothetical protein [Candidatus Riflebacteria bacterium]